MKKILICSGFLPPNINEKIYHNSPAENNFINGLVNELKEYTSIEFLTYIAFKLEKEQKKIINDKIVSQNMTCVYRRKNLVVNYIEYYFNLISKLNNIDYVILYGVNIINIFIPIISKMMLKKSILILSDYTTPNEVNGIKRMIAKKIYNTFSKFNGVVFLSPILMNKTKVKKSILIHGGIEEEDFIDFTMPKHENTINILYSGLLSEATGVDLLIEVMKRFDFNKYSNVKFVITGKGPLKKEIQEISSKSNNVKYLGFLSRKEYLEYLKKAHLLLNPRNMHLEQNKNNFPSKIIEYIATGRIIVSTKFAGYENFMENIILVDTDIEQIKRALEKSIDNYLDLHGNYFVKNRQKVENYYWKEQSRKLNEFLLEI